MEENERTALLIQNTNAPEISTFTPVQLFIPLYLPVFLFSLCEEILLPVIPYFILKDLNLSTSYVGFVFTVQAFGDLLCATLVGKLHAIFGAKIIIIFSQFIRCFSSLLIYFFHRSYAILCICLFIEGCGDSGWKVGQQTFLAVRTKKSNRGKIVSYLAIIKRLGKVFGPLIGGWIISFFQIQYAFLFRFIFSLPPIVIIIIYFPYGGTKSKKKKSASICSVMNEEGKILTIIGIFGFILTWVRSVKKIILTLALAGQKSFSKVTHLQIIFFIHKV